MAVDARLVHSVSQPVSGRKLEELREERKQEESEKGVRFQIDVDSDWTVRDGESFSVPPEHPATQIMKKISICNFDQSILEGPEIVSFF
jgi:hypothetical protein